MTPYIARAASTGVYHFAIGPRSTFCNGRGRSYVRPAKADEIAKAAPASFCRKCFGDVDAASIEQFVASVGVAS